VLMAGRNEGPCLQACTCSDLICYRQTTKVFGPGFLPQVSKLEFSFHKFLVASRWPAFCVEFPPYTLSMSSHAHSEANWSLPSNIHHPAPLDGCIFFAVIRAVTLPINSTIEMPLFSLADFQNSMRSSGVHCPFIRRASILRSDLSKVFPRRVYLAVAWPWW
jgi:hypothetical protein